MMTSKIMCLGPVTFPEFDEGVIFSAPFYQFEGLPKKYERWQPTVDDMLRGITTGLRIYLYAQQKKVKKLEKHYDRDLHIDGNTSETGEGYAKLAENKATVHFDGLLRDEVTVHASNMLSLRACVGRFCGVPSMTGSVAHIDTGHGYWVPMDAGFAYAGNETMFHESVGASKEGERTIVRLAIPHFTLERIRRNY